MPIHVASALLFTVPGRIFYNQTLVRVLRANDLEPLDAWHELPNLARMTADRRHLTVRPDGAAAAAAMALAEANQAALDRCHGVFAVMDGTDVESGVAAEIGYAAARGLPVVGWRSDVRRAGEPISAHVSVQLEHFVAISGGGIFNDLDLAVTALKRLTRSQREGN